ncbi:MAG: FecR domain-containing protein [Gammaproteobacteria bacterium]|nr:FecR domain-containing protein [Gammaproteobacteria bacterium]
MKHTNTPAGNAKPEAIEPIAGLIRAAGLRQSPRPEFVADLRVQLLHEWREQVSRQRDTRRKRRAIGAGLAAGIIVAVAGWLSLYTPASEREFKVLSVQGSPVIAQSSGGERGVLPNDVIPFDSVIATGINDRASLAIGGSGSLRIDSLSEVRFTDPNRIGLTAGRIYIDFESAHAEDKIVVTTPLGDVRDVGTQFIVALVDEDVIVQVRNGKVTMHHPAKSVDVLPGERLQVSSAGDAIKEPAAYSGEQWQWVEALADQFDFKDATVAEFLEYVHKETGLRVVYENDLVAERAGRIRFGGEFPELAPRELLKLVMSTTRFNYVIEGETLFIHE